MSITLRLENNIGYLEFDHPDSKVNILTGSVIRRLDGLLDEVKKDASIKALVVLSKKKDVFIAGADIEEIENITESKDGEAKARAGQDVFNKLEDLAIPTVAVIDGVALGGGCEFALACLYRVATFNEKIRIGLPEVNLGFVPGFGGTYRLPRTLGLAEGLKMILSGQPVNSVKALKLGLVDRLFPQEGLTLQVQRFVESVLKGNIRKKRFSPPKAKGLQETLNGSLIYQAIVFYQSHRSVLNLTKGFYPAPLKAIDVIKKNYYVERKEALAIEAKAFSELAIGNISKNLVKFFYLSEKYRKLRIDGAEGVKPKVIEKSAVLGAGVMGGGIAQLLSAKGIWARMKDINYDCLEKGLQAAAKLYKQAMEKRKLTRAEAQRHMAQISTTLDYSGFKTVDIVIEAVVENMEIKKKVFKELSEVCREGTILASNTSALSITELARVVKDPSAVIGFHFFNPVHRMPLIEIITTPMTSRETIHTSLELARRLGKTPILVKDSCGFIVNRILLGYINEAGRILEEGGSVEVVDKIMTDFGMPMGPFTLSDEVGLDVGVKVLHILEEHLGARFKPVEIFETIYKKGLLGKKSGKGFYLHGNERTLNTEVVQLISHRGKNFDRDVLLKRMVYIMINEGAKCLEEGIVDDPGAIDVGMIMGTGFPAFRGGLLRYADSIGTERIVNTLEKLSLDLKADRFNPCRYLLELKSNKKKFFN